MYCIACIGKRCVTKRNPLSLLGVFYAWYALQCCRQDMHMLERNSLIWQNEPVMRVEIAIQFGGLAWDLNYWRSLLSMDNQILKDAILIRKPLPSTLLRAGSKAFLGRKPCSNTLHKVWPKKTSLWIFIIGVWLRRTSPGRFENYHKTLQTRMHIHLKRLITLLTVVPMNKIELPAHVSL